MEKDLIPQIVIFLNIYHFLLSFGYLAPLSFKQLFGVLNNFGEWFIIISDPGRSKF